MDGVAFELEKGLRAGQDLMRVIHGDITEVAAALTYLALVLAILSGLVSRDHGAGLKAASQSLLCLIIFSAYDEIFISAVRASDALSFVLREQSGYTQTLTRTMNSAAQYMHSQDDVFDMMTGLVKGEFLAEANLLTHEMVFYVTLFIVFCTQVLLNALYVLGPFMVAGGAFGNGATLNGWAKLLFQVLLWPVFPCFVLLVNSYASSNVAVAADNLSLSMSTNIFLSVLVFFTPMVTLMLTSPGGAAAMGAVAWGAGLKLGGTALSLAGGAVGSALGALGSVGGSFSQAGVGTGAAAFSSASAMGVPTGRPDDAQRALLPPTQTRLALPAPAKLVGPEGPGQWQRGANPSPRLRTQERWSPHGA